MRSDAGLIFNRLQKLPRFGHWLVVASTAILFLIVETVVDLKPQVDENFFFSSSDPKFQESKKIDQLFPSGDQLIVSVSSADISSTQYLDRLDQLTHKIKSIPAVSGVRSLTDGPK